MIRVAGCHVLGPMARIALCRRSLEMSILMAGHTSDCFVHPGQGKCCEIVVETLPPVKGGDAMACGAFR